MNIVDKLTEEILNNLLLVTSEDLAQIQEGSAELIKTERKLNNNQISKMLSAHILAKYERIHNRGLKPEVHEDEQERNYENALINLRRAVVEMIKEDLNDLTL